MKQERNTYFAYRSFWPEPEAHRRFNDIGVKTVCFFPSNTVNSLGEPYCLYPPNWVWGKSRQGQYDFDPIDAQVADLLEASPGADLMCMVDLNTPPWLSAHRLYCDSFNQLGRLCSDPEWRDVTANYMRALMTHMAERHGDKVVAYVLAGGATSEWYDHSKLVESESRLAAWTEDLERRGLPPSDIPGMLKRNHVSFDGLLRDPQRDGDSLRYIKFCADQIVDAIKFFLKEARTVVRPEIELGVFHGYPLVLSGARVILGNNDCGELLECPDLDFIITPNGGFSKIGDGGGDLGPTESVLLHGKTYLRECDQKTHTYNRKISKHVSTSFGTWNDEKETLAGLKRELAYTLIKGCSCWWFDMWGGFYDPPVVMDLLEKGREIYFKHIDDPVRPVAEIALIVDPDSIYYLNQRDLKRTRWFYPDVKLALDRVGAPYECYHFNDIPDIPDKKRVKLWLMPGLFEITPKKRDVLDEHVRLGGNTAFFMYAPGISDGKTLDADRIKDICGVDFGTPGINVTKFARHTAVHAATGPDVTSTVLKNIAADAGVWMYTSREQPVYANDKFVAVHAAKGGLQTVRLPRESAQVQELFTDQVVAENCREFEYEFQAPDTGLFRY